VSISFESLIGTSMILSILYVYIKNNTVGIHGSIILLFGTILIGISSWKEVNISLGKDGLNASFNTLAKEIKKINDYTENLNLKLLRQEITKIEIHSAEFNENEAREEINMRMKGKTPEAYIWKKKCEQVVKYDETYPLISKKYKEKSATSMIATCQKAKELNPNNLKYTFLMAIAYHRSQNYQETIAIMKELANKKYPIAQRKLGLMYLFGNLVNQDIKKAKKWLFLAAENGDKASQLIFNRNLLENI